MAAKNPRWLPFFGWNFPSCAQKIWKLIRNFFMIFNLFERVIQYLKNYRADFWYLFLLQNGGRSCIVPKLNYFFANFWHVKLNNLKNNADIHNSFCNFLDITLLHNSWKFQDERMNGSGDFLRAVNPVFAKFAFWEKGLLVKQVPFSLIFHKELFAIHSLCHNSAKNALIFSIFFLFTLENSKELI